MKRFCIFVLVLLLAISVISCSKGETKEKADTNIKSVIVDNEDVDKSTLKEIKIGLVTDTGGIDDKSFNQGTWEGLVYYKEKFELPDENLGYLQSTTDADYIPNLTQYCEEKRDLIVAPGFLFTNSIEEVSKNFPDQKILFIDSVVDSPNVANAVFAEHEGSFLVGVAAALKAKEDGKNKVGFVGGADFDLIQKFEAGFEQGVKAVDKNIEIDIKYVGHFDKPEEGQTIAAKMYDDGAHVIYHAAGGSGNGVIKEGKDRAKNGTDAWVIGVDKDQYLDGIYEGDKSVILTSMVKRVDQVSYEMAKKVAQDKFKGGVFTYGVKENGVLIPANNPNLKDDWVKTINEYREKIVSGEIKVDPVPTRVK